MAEVLLVEDDRDVRETMVEILEAEGHSVTAVAGALAALTRLEQPGAPALVLLDLRMPGMGGLSFLNALQTRPDRERYRVILMSADRSVGHLLDAPSVVAILHKPFENSQLLELLEAHADTESAEG
jgi:CheY-like chemotaxis protein